MLHIDFNIMFYIYIYSSYIHIYTYSFFEFLGVANAGELRLNPNINRTIQHAGPGHSFFISCLPYSDEAQSISDSRFRAKELSWKKLRKVPVAEWVVMGSASHQRY